MSAVTYEGVVDQGNIRLPDGIKLPEAQRVIVVVLDDNPVRTIRMPSFRLVDPGDAGRFEKTLTVESDDAGV